MAALAPFKLSQLVSLACNERTRAYGEAKALICFNAFLPCIQTQSPNDSEPPWL